jgi:hypothetical protein
VLDAQGVRWAEDLGKESYGTFEKHGVRIWNRRQGSDRWKVFRHNNRSHNTLVVDGKPQRADSFSPVVGGRTEGPERFTIVDMGPAYEGQLAAARRGLALHEAGTVVVQDEVKADSPSSVRWGMVTRAGVEVLTPTVVCLTRGERTLHMTLEGPDGVGWEEYSTDTNYAFARSTEGTTMVGFTVAVPAGESSWRVIVHSTRDSDLPGRRPLAEW